MTSSLLWVGGWCVRGWGGGDPSDITGSGAGIEMWGDGAVRKSYCTVMTEQ